MNNSILENLADGISPDILHTSLDKWDDLTQQDIESGLDALHQAVIHHGLPLIVLIEDDENEACFFRQALRDIGTAVEFMHFRDGHQAIDFFTGNGCYADRERFPLPQLTVLDIKLTRASGLEILHEIRIKPQSEQLIVVALTGSEDACEIERAQSLEINGWVNKPNRASDLIDIVRCLMQKWLPSAN